LDVLITNYGFSVFDYVHVIMCLFDIAFEGLFFVSAPTPTYKKSGKLMLPNKFFFFLLFYLSKSVKMKGQDHICTFNESVLLIRF
jgi:hypothetical protein